MSPKVPSLEVKLATASDYMEWRNQLEPYFLVEDLSDFIYGKTKDPSSVKQEEGESESKGKERAKDSLNWKKKDALAMIFIRSNVKTAVLKQLGKHKNSNELWKALEAKFDRKTTGSLHKTHSKLLSLRCTDPKNIAEHLDNFTTIWSDLEDRSAVYAREATTVDVAYGYWIYLGCTSDSVKAALLVQSLQHNAFDTIVQLLQAKEKLTYEDTYEQLSNFQEKHGRKSEVTTAAFVANDKKDCGYCKKRGKAASHQFSECRRIKADKKRKEQEEQANSATANIAGAWMAMTDDGYESGDSQISFENSTWQEDYQALVNALAPVPITQSSLVPQHYEEEEAAETLFNLGRKNEAAITLAQLRESAFNTICSSGWLFDTGATSHMIGEKPRNTTMNKCGGYVNTAGGRKIEIEGTLPTMTIHSLDPKGNSTTIELENVLYVPKLKKVKLLSWNALAKKGYTGILAGDSIAILDSSRKPILKCQVRSNGGYFLQQSEMAFSAQATSEDWHKRLGHPSTPTYNLIRKTIPELPPASTKTCSTCATNKITQKNRPTIPIKTTRPLELVHSDLSGRFSTRSLSGAEYYVSIIDDYSRMAFVYYLKRKSDASQAIKQWTAMAENATGKKVQRFRRDNGGEYQEILPFFKEKGIQDEPIVPYSHQSNGVAERFNRTIFTIARTMLNDSTLPPSLWEQAIGTATHVKNRLVHQTTQLTPFESFFGRKPDISHFRIFGEKTVSLIPKEKQKGKLEPKGQEGYMVGYGNNTKTYLILLKGSKKIITSRDVTFIGCLAGGTEKEPKQQDTDSESEFSSDDNDSNTEDEDNDDTSSNKGYEEDEIPKRPTTPMPGTFDDETDDDDAVDYVSEDDNEEPSLPPPIQSAANVPIFAPVPTSDDTALQEMLRRADEKIEDILPPSTPPPFENEDIRPPTPLEPRRSGRRTVTPSRFTPSAFIAEFMVDPQSYKEATSGTEAPKWTKAMNQEISALEENQTWTIVPKPNNRKTIRSRWVFHRKLAADGTVARYKARLVAKGYSQIPGQDYDQTFAPVCRYESLRILLALIATHPSQEWQMYHSDVANAFLNGILKEEIFMEAPEGIKLDKGLVYKLHKCLYGLKQASREWYESLTKEMAIQGFTPCAFDPCVFKHETGKIVLAIYVDDLLLFSCNKKLAIRKHNDLNSTFKMTDLEPAEWALGMKITFGPTITISQKAYLERVLERFGMSDCKPVTTPIDPKALPLRKFDPEHDELLEDTQQYQAIIGSLMYAVMASRPDLAYTVTMLSQYNANPTQSHMNAAKRVLRYVKGTLSLSLHYTRTRKENTTLTCYSDASYASNIDDRKSFSGNCCLINNCLVSWNAQKQRSVSVSTTEAEYKALSEAARQTVWLKRGLLELKCLTSGELTVKVLEDNEGAIALARDPVFHKRSKHIDVHYHKVREYLARNEFTMEHVKTGENAADLFTKGLERVKHVYFLHMISCHE